MNKTIEQLAEEAYPEFTMIGSYQCSNWGSKHRQAAFIVGAKLFQSENERLREALIEIRDMKLSVLVIKAIATQALQP